MTRSARHPQEGPLSEAEFADAFAGLEQAPLILAAVSGGPDSTALMGGLARWSAASGGRAVRVATVDHGLRPASRDEAEGVAALAAKLSLSHAVLTWTDRKRSRPSQDAARRARYRLLLAHAGEIGATHLLTAHTLDDQAETILMRLAAGTGLSGLAGMRREVDRGGVGHVRPFLTIAKARLVATCRERGWPFVEDPSNVDATFARARWRTILPQLAAEGLDAPRLARLAERTARADAALARLASEALGDARVPGAGATAIDLRRLLRHPAEIALRALGLALGGTGAELRLERLEACFDALAGARNTGVALRRTLAGQVLKLDRAGILTFEPEGVRRRGRRQAVTAIAFGDSASLGTDHHRA